MPIPLATAFDRPVLRFGGAIGLVAGSFLLRQVLSAVFGQSLPPYITFAPAVMIVALLGGFWSGVLATVLSALVVDLAILPRFGHFSLLTSTDLIGLIFFVGMGIFMSLVAEYYRRSQQSLAEATQKLALQETQDKLLESEEQFESLANSIPQLCWMADADGTAFWHNQRWYDYTGMTGGLAMGWSWQSVLDADTRTQVLEKWEASIATGQLFEMVIPLRGKDGELRSFLTRVVPFKDGADKVVRWFGTNTDIESQMEIQEKLRRTNARLDLALEVAGLGEWELNLREGVASRSPLHARIFGHESLQPEWSYEKFLGQVLPECRDEVKRLFREGLAKGDWEFETQIRRLDGEVRWIWCRARRVVNEAGEPIRLYGTVMDISERKQAEEEKKMLLQSVLQERDTLAALIRSMNDEVWFVDREKRFALLNVADFAELGYQSAAKRDIKEFDRETEVRRSDGSLRLLDESPPIRALHGEVVRNEEEMLLSVETGEVRHRELNAAPIQDASGNILGSFVVVRDITERRNAEKRIQEMSRTYSLLSDVNQMIVREKDAQKMLTAACRIAVVKGKFRMAWVGMLTPGTHQLKPIASCGAVDEDLAQINTNLSDPERAKGPVARCVFTGMRAVCNDIETDPGYAGWREMAIRRGYRSVAGFPLKVHGEVVGTFGLYAGEPNFFDDAELGLLDDMAMDISYALEVNRHEIDRIKAEEDLRWRTALFEAQLEANLDGILVVGHDRKVLVQNRRIHEIWKLPEDFLSDELASTSIELVRSQLRHPEEFLARAEYLYAHREEISQEEVELIDGTILDHYSSPVKDKSGRYYGRIWIFHDITNRRRLEQQLRQSQKMEAVGQLTGGIAHDFNNLLGVILGNLDLLEGLSVQNQHRVQRAIKAASGGAELSRRLLTLSSSVELRSNATFVQASIRNVAELAEAVAPDVAIVVNLDESMAQVLVDPGGLESALLNLVVNSRDAMPNGGSLTISTGTSILDQANPLVLAGELKPTSYACISLSDSGHGMSPETLERVFEPFFTTKPQGKGTGLGLAMVYGFARQSGGAIRISSEPGRGTTVTLYLPFADKVAAFPSTDDAAAVRSQGSGKVLVVDDEPGILEIAVIYLNQMGYTAFEAKDGKEALAVIAEHQDVDLVVTDIIMPGGMTGIQLAQEIRRIRPLIKIVYCSGFPAKVMAERGMTVIDGQLLRKPYQRSEFEEAIRMAVA